MVENDKTPWVLKAQLIWDQSKEISGAKLIITNPGEIKKIPMMGLLNLKIVIWLLVHKMRRLDLVM